MTDEPKESRSNIIKSVTQPLGFFVLFLLVAEAILGILVVNAAGVERIVAIVGMLVLLLMTLAIVAYITYRRPETLAEQKQKMEDPGLQIIEFEQIFSEISKTIENLEQKKHGKLEHYLKIGDFSRLIDGLYSSLLYASGAVVTGKIDPIFYGNLFDWEETSKSLRVRYFKGPYNDEIITRHFPIEGSNQGVASAALMTGEIQVRNSMKDMLVVAGESRLKSMMSIPVMHGKKGLENKTIAVINIDCVKENAFPYPESKEFELVQKRANQIAELVRRVNKLSEEKLVEDFETMKLAAASEVTAPDGSRVFPLLSLGRGSMAQFVLKPGQVSRAVVHHTIEEIWFFTSGHGEMWRKQEKSEEITPVEVGMCITIPCGVHFQFRSMGDEPLIAIAITMPPWSGDTDAKIVDGKWEPIISP